MSVAAIPLAAQAPPTAPKTAPATHVTKDQINVEIEGDEVVISAETRRAENKEGENWLYAERRFGKVQRRVIVPQEIDEAAAEARFNDGVLELTLPKKAPQAVKRVEVR